MKPDYRYFGDKASDTFKAVYSNLEGNPSVQKIKLSDVHQRVLYVLSVVRRFVINLLFSFFLCDFFCWFFGSFFSHLFYSFLGFLYHRNIYMK